MKPLKSLSVQCSDLLAYLLIPLLSLLIPGRASRKLVRSASHWSWLLAGELRVSLRQAANYVDIEDHAQWLQRARMVMLLEARDLGLLMLGRQTTVFSEIAGSAQLSQARDRVLIGMHWGPSIAILALLKHLDQRPLLVFRSVERSILRQRPFFWLYLVLSVRHIRKMCGDRAITIRGAGARLAEELPRPGTSVVVLDAPPAPGRSTLIGTVAGHRVKFNAGFPEILKASGRNYHFYAITLQPGDSGLRQLELGAACSPGDALIEDYCRYLEDHLLADSAQWRIWQVAGQFFVARPGAKTTKAADEASLPAEQLY
ncbi:MAG: hypothetical protein KJO85_02255 [Gammaproteobacteria bacterium]|nr:hypothetical protein [Gammaproteobacteria bacterium]